MRLRSGKIPRPYQVTVCVTVAV